MTGIAIMKLTRLLSFGALIPGLFLAQYPAMAVPGWAQTWKHISLPPGSCISYVDQAIKQVTGSGGTFDKISDTTYLMTTYPQGTTGVFLYCVSNPNRYYGYPTSTLLIVAFSDNGSGEAVYWRDRLNNAVGSYSTSLPNSTKLPANLNGSVPHTPSHSR